MGSYIVQNLIYKYYTCQDKLMHLYNKTNNEIDYPWNHKWKINEIF